MIKTIVVNNPAAKEGGVLTILKEFLEKISVLKCNRKFFIITSVKELKKYENINIKINIILRQNFKQRILWDNFGINRYLKNKKIIPDIILSLQNTGVNIDAPQIIYYQQSLSLSSLNWNPLKSEERLYWLYKNIYPIFIKWHLSKAKKIIVQTEWVKKEFSNKFKYQKDRIVLMRPQVKKIDINLVNTIPKKKFRIFYPAASYIYKNHKVIIEVLYLLKMKNLELLKNIECIFTFNQDENIELYNLINKYELSHIVNFIGKIPYEKVLEYYKSSDLLVFPSSLETFGLPLVEAQQFELQIIANKLPYSIEVVGDYKKCILIKDNNYSDWLRSLEKLIQNGKENKN